MHNQDASPNVNNCVLVGNDVDVMGGGMLNEGVLANPTIVNCVFYDNTAWRGGAICTVTEGSHPEIINCTITENIALDAPGRPPGPRIGGGMYIGYASPTVTNTILFGNHDEFDDESSINDEIYNYSGIANPSFRASDVNHCGESGDGWNDIVGNDGVYNIAQDPGFTNKYKPDGMDGIWATYDDGLRLDRDSPCIDKADGDFAPERDICGAERYDAPPAGGGVGTPDYVDIGAYENTGWTESETGPVVIVMCWIDESHNSYLTADSSGQTYFETHLGDYSALTGSGQVRVLSGCLVPLPTVPSEAVYSTIADVLYDGYPGIDPESPPSILMIRPDLSVKEFDRVGYDSITVDDFITEFNRIRQGLVPDYVVLIVDNSTSMVTATINPEPDYPYTTFKSRIASEYPDAALVEIDGPYDFLSELWIEAMNIEIEAIINGL